VARFSRYKIMRVPHFSRVLREVEPWLLSSIWCKRSWFPSFDCAQGRLFRKERERWGTHFIGDTKRRWADGPLKPGFGLSQESSAAVTFPVLLHIVILSAEGPHARSLRDKRGEAFSRCCWLGQNSLKLLPTSGERGVLRLRGRPLRGSPLRSG